MKKYEKPAIEIVEANLSTDYLQPLVNSQGPDQFSVGGDNDDRSVYEDDFEAEGW